MKVTAVCPLYPPASRVGAWLSTHECLADLVARGHEVDVVVQLGRRRPDYTLDGVHVHVGAGHLERYVVDADVVISHLGDPGRAHAAAVAAGVPSVRMAHGGPARIPDDTALVVFNAHSARAAADWPGPAAVVHPPVDPHRYCTTPGEAVTLINLTDAKGVRTFWRAAELLPDLTFLGVRGGYGRQVRPRAANIEVVATVRDITRIYQRTRVLLMPSAEESWGRVGVEAMASGIPVIAHPTPGLVESLGSAGVFVDRDDITGWAAAIRHTHGPGWAAASAAATARSAELDPGPELDRFAAAIESLT